MQINDENFSAKLRVRLEGTKIPRAARSSRVLVVAFCNALSIATLTMDDSLQVTHPDESVLVVVIRDGAALATAAVGTRANVRNVEAVS